jgi:hypothetical protein
MANEKTPQKPHLAKDGHQPRPLHKDYQPPPAVPEKVQGGYQAPIGEGKKPAAPTTGSGVTKPAAPVPPKK